MKLAVIILAASAAFCAPAADWSAVKPYVSAVDKAKGAGKADFTSSVKDGALVVVVRGLENAVVKARVRLPGEADFRGRHMELRLVTSAEGPSQMGVLLQGHIDRSGEGKGDGHYWKPSTIPLSPAPSVWRKTRFIDPKTKDLDLTWEIREPGVYRFHDWSFAPGKDPMDAYEPGRNYLVNGGAERGFYATTSLDAGSFRFGTCGGVIEPFKGKVATGVASVAVDDGVARTGRRSFRLTRGKDDFGALYLNPVPFVQGREFVFSFWVKASEKRWFKAGLCVASGAVMEQPFPATTEWTKVEIKVPKWGEGRPELVSMKDVPFVVPYVEPGDRATFWVDDAFATVGTLSGEPARTDWTASARLVGHADGVVRPGEPFAVEYELVNLSDRPLTVTGGARLADWWGEPAGASVPLGSVALAPRAAKTFRREWKAEEIPGRLRGPVTVEAVFGSGGATDTVWTAFGVQPAPKRLHPKLGVNVMFGSPERTLAIMKEFGVGMARLWGGGRGWDLDYGYRYSKLFHDAGVRNLFVLGSPILTHGGKTLRTEALLPKDTSAWFARQMELVDAHRGEVDVYEFLNEYNIWKGRLANPDPTRFDEPTMAKYLAMTAAFRPLLRAHDPEALLAGCATCSTDLGFIGEFLEKGGGASVDMITEHAYNGNPDCPDYDAKLGRGLAAARKAGVAKWAQTEAGSVSPNHPVPGRTDPAALHQAEVDLRNMLIAWANGLDHYSHFQLVPGRLGTDWNLTWLGNGDNGGRDLPKPALYAFRVAADLVGEAEPAGRADLGPGVKCYLFARGSRSVAAIWKWSGASVAWPGSPVPETVFVDMMGMKGPDGRFPARPLSVCPVYAVSKLPVGELKAELERRRVGATGPAEFEGADASDPNMQILKE